MIFLKVLGWLINPFRILFDFLGKRLDADVEHHRIDSTIDVAAMQADVELARLRKDLLMAQQGWWATRWIVPGFAYPLILWHGMVVLDSTFRFSFVIDRLPEPIMSWAGQIILSFFLVRGVEIVGGAIRTSALGKISSAVESALVTKIKSNVRGQK